LDWAQHKIQSDNWIEVIAVKIVLVIAGFLVAAAAAFAVAMWGSEDTYELYIRSSARVWKDGQELADARVFKGSKDHLLLMVDSDDRSPLIYLPESEDVGACNPSTFVNAVVFGLQKHSRDGHYPCAGSGKQELIQNIAHSEVAVAFNAWDWNSKKTCRIEIRGPKLARQ
jgi:hypothetical protein